MDNRQTLRLKVAQYYLENDASFRQAALKFQIAYCTIFRWVRLYKEQGEEGLLSTYKRPWNRARPDFEQRIILMKEHEPGLTVRKARERLEKEDIRISVKGIWGIWKRYGYAGFSQKMASNFTDCSWTKEAKEKYELAKRLFDCGSITRSAEILNSIPALPENELLLQIPDSLLNTRRRVEKTEPLFGKIPVHSYLERARNLYEECQSRNFYYSALIVGLVETVAISWSGEPLKMLERVEELSGMLKKNGNYYSYLLFAPRLSLLIAEGFAHTMLLKTKKASDIARTCRRLIKRRKHVAPRFKLDLGQLYNQLDDFRKAEYWHLEALDELGGDEKKIAKFLLADVFIAEGEYKKALATWKEGALDYWGGFSKRLRIQSIWALVRGMPHKAISLATEVLALLEKEESKGSMFGCCFTIASAYCSLGEKIRARQMLRGILPFFVKNRLEDVKTIIDTLLSQAPSTSNSIPLFEQSLPTIRLVILLKNGQYARALKYAEKKGMAGLLHRYIFFFPEAVMDLLEKGKPTGLPRAMLNLPVFRKEIPVYSVKFLGNLIVYKNQKYMRVQLTPKDTSFLVHLAAAKSRHIALDRIYKNFWPDSKNPARNLAHLLVRIRKVICLPSHYLYVKNNRLCFDCHFITDCGEYQEHLAQATAFLRAGEWTFAKAEYLQAFSLFRATPFEKMYDNWSEDMRRTILGSLENEAIRFADACVAHGNRAKGIETLQKISQIIPYADEINNRINNVTAD
ncbi:helix-turn-helix domain-containing protein [candidate division WOR-3 bacterium]|nr:helix-turn-helix domain-containing protein [candidate division WOR-3 bacterium]